MLGGAIDSEGPRWARLGFKLGGLLSKLHDDAPPFDTVSFMAPPAPPPGGPIPAPQAAAVSPGGGLDGLHSHANLGSACGPASAGRLLVARRTGPPEHYALSAFFKFLCCSALPSATSCRVRTENE